MHVAIFVYYEISFVETRMRNVKIFCEKTLGYFVKRIFVKYMRYRRRERQSFADRPTKAGGDERGEL